MRLRIQKLGNRLAALLIASTTFVACSSSDDSIVEPQQPAGPKTYTMTVQATKGGEGTRALSLSGSTLSTTWATGEKVTVYNVTSSTELGGYLEAKSDGETTTLEGRISGTINNNDQLKLKFLSPSYNGQNGTLSYIASHCDYAEASVTATVSENSITTTAADFVNQQAIIKFTLKNGNYSLIADALRVSDGTNTIVMTDISGSTHGVLYVAMPGFSGKTVTLDAYCHEELYTYSKTNVSFANGSYYNVTVMMSPATNVNLSNVISNLELQDGNTVNGTLGNIVEISIADGATVTLNGATINGTNDNRYAWAGLNCIGNATINLANGSTNTIKGFSNHPGINVPSGYTLTINGTGTLNASSNGWGAGIGGCDYTDCGHITISGGTVTATGGTNSTGIGSGKNTSCGNITISGGKVTANGGQYSAGIGSGNGGSCGVITISGGEVTANGGEKGAGIGRGYMSSSDGDITISGGTVTATGGQYGAGIGSGFGISSSHSTCGDITISGGTVTAKGGNLAAGIGSASGSKDGNYSSCGAITIISTVTRVEATKGVEATNSIGAGKYGTCGTVKIGGVEGAISDSPYIYPAQ